MKLLAGLLLAALPVSAGQVMTFECKRPDCLMMTEADLERLIDANDRNYERAEAAEQRVRELEAGYPKCAKVEVTEPPKREIPPLVKERDL